MTPGLAVTAAGAVTAVGFNGPSTFAALRAGVRNVNQTNLWDPETGSYLAAGRVLLPHWWVGVGKLAELVAPAILECMLAARPVQATSIPVLLGLSSPSRPHRLSDLDRLILPEVEQRLGIRLNAASKVVARDRVSVVAALRHAAELLAARHAPCVIVAAVDSLVQHDLKDYYLSRRRLLTPTNSNGFSLGEAGSALLVTGAGAHPDGELRVCGMGLAFDRATVESEEPLRADGLTQAIREAFGESGSDIQDVQYRVTDLNGEHFKFKEMTLAMLRFEREPKPRLFEIWHPIEYMGDVGAAIGPLILGLALHAGRRGYAVGPRALATLSNDDGERAALVVVFNRAGSS